MPLIRDREAGFVDSGDKELDRQLREGDGLVWKGDPDLELHYGIMSAPKRMQHPSTNKWLNRGDMIAKRYEVWRHVEGGTDEMLAHWRMDERHKILVEISGMRASFEGKAPSTIDKIDAANAKLEAAKSTEFRDSYGEMLEHAMLLAHDISQPQTSFRQVGGSDEKPDRNLAS